MKYSIRMKLSLGFGIILLVFLTASIVNIFALLDSNQRIKELSEKDSRLITYYTDADFASLQVQQWITDGSLTREQDSINQAEKYAKMYRDSMGQVVKLEPSLKGKLDEINLRFDEFYKLGIEMANAYKDQGIVQGNALMEKFDPEAEAMTNAVEGLRLESNKQLTLKLQEINQKMNQIMLGSLMALGATLLISIIIILRLGKQLVHPIKAIQGVLNEMEKGEGDLTFRIPVVTRDEIGHMAKSFNGFMDSLEEMVGSIKETSEHVSIGAEQVGGNSNRSTDGIRGIDKHMDGVTSDSNQISKLISQITESIGEIAAASQTTAIDSQDISEVAGNINDLAEKSGELAEKTKQEMLQVQQLSIGTVGITGELGNEAKEIGQIIDTIKAITSQTNLLALNAAIEAARAGEQGKGFGVVASEIRALAETNNESAKNIEEIIARIQSKIELTVKATEETRTSIQKGNDLVQNVYLSLQEIIKAVAGINDKIQSIAASTEEQSASTEELASTMDVMNNSNLQVQVAIEGIAESIKDQSDIAASLKESSKVLEVNAHTLNGLVGKFKL